MTEPWVSVEDVAKHLGVVNETVYRWIESKRLPAQKIGKLWKLKLSEVDAWVRAGELVARTTRVATNEEPRAESRSTNRLTCQGFSAVSGDLRRAGVPTRAELP